MVQQKKILSTASSLRENASSSSPHVPPPPATAAPSAWAPLLGRSAEHAAIVEFIQHRLIMHHKKILFLCGPCGVGKSSTMQRVMLTPFSETPLPVPTSSNLQNHPPSTAAVSPTPPQSSMSRAVRFHYVNCADFSGKGLVEEVVRLVRYRQRTSQLLDAQLQLLQLLADSNKFNKQLEDLAIKWYEPRCPKTYDQLSKIPLHCLVLDEADFTRSGTASSVVAAIVQLALRCPVWFAVTLVSNSRGLSFLSAADSIALTFGAYDVATLKQIGAEAAKAYVDASSESQRARATSGRRSGGKAATIVEVADAALAYAAKTTVLQHCGDARKVKELCVKAVDERLKIAARQLSDEVAAAKRPRSSSSSSGYPNSDDQITPQRGRRSENKEPSTVAKVVTVGVKDAANAAQDIHCPDANALVSSLPELTTYVLCCIVVLARKKVMSSLLISRSCVTNHDQAAKKQFIEKTNRVLFQDSGDLTLFDVHRTYAALMTRLVFPMCSYEAVLRSMEDLAARKLITNPTSFRCTGQWSLGDLETALVRRGCEMVQREAEILGADNDRAKLLTNKFADAIATLSLCN